MSEYWKVYNPDPKPLLLKVVLENFGTSLSLPAHGGAVVSGDVVKVLQQHYAQLEVGEATLEEYQEYRLLKQKQEEVEKVAALLADTLRKESEKEARVAEEEHKKNTAEQQAAKDDLLNTAVSSAVEAEEESLARVHATTARVASTGNLPPEHVKQVIGKRSKGRPRKSNVETNS